MQIFRTIVAFVVLLVPTFASAQPSVKPGADVLVEKRLDLVRGKRVGLVTNHTGRLISGEFVTDALLLRKVSVTALFGPEHGIRGGAEAGEKVIDSIDRKSGIPVYSLYGKISKPTPGMLQNVDVLVYDIQDVGARFYTYLSTMTLAMEAAAEKGIPFVVLDRPDPLGGILVDGPVLADSLRSFVGMHQIPVVYGLTCGELASMINGEGWLKGRVKADLIVVPMEGWHRSMRWNDTGLLWLAPSPNIPRFETALVYPATCFLEGTNLSEGRGTNNPFCLFGAPFVDSVKLTDELTSLKLPGVRFSPSVFTPSSSKFEGRECRGTTIKLTDPASYRPLLLGLNLFQELLKLYPTEMTFRMAWFNKLMGHADVISRLRRGESPGSILASWQPEIDQFRASSKKYWLY